MENYTEDFTKEIYSLITDKQLNIEDIANTLTQALNAAKDRVEQEKLAQEKEASMRHSALTDLYDQLGIVIAAYGLGDVFEMTEEEEFIKAVDSTLTAMAKLRDIKNRSGVLSDDEQESALEATIKELFEGFVGH